MKRLVSILSLLVALAAASCTHPEPAMPMPEAPQHSELAAIDTLMQSQPDSALSAILPIFESDTIAPFDRHYADLLLSEALFKNDCEQTARPALLDALNYFDSLAAVQPKSDDYTLLSARSHYMSGVGFMESDSVVEACAEYLKALEIMEDRFDEKELVGQRAKFMALTYNRLGDLFSDQYMTEQAIFCLKESLSLFEGEGSCNTIFYLGLHYEMASKNDSAIYYYNNALKQLPDTNCLLYRDIISNKAYIDFFSGGDQKTVIDDLKRMKEKADDDKEIITRFFAIGCIYFRIRQYDSAVVYLKTVFNDSSDYQRQLQVADYLGKIYDSIGEPEESKKYSRFLAEHTLSEYGKRNVASKLNDLLQQYQQKKQEIKLSKTKHSIFQKYAFITAVLIIAAIILIITIRYKAKKKYEQKDQQHTALVNRMQNANARLREENRRLSEATPADTPTNGIPSLDDYEALMREPACLELLGRFSKTDIVTTNSPETYAGLSLSKADEKRIDVAIERHCPNFLNRIATLHPDLGKAELNLCKYLLLGLGEPQIAVLMQNTFSSTWRKTANIRKKMGCSDIHQHLKSVLFEAKKA